MQDNPYWQNICSIAERQRAKGMKTYGVGIEDNPADIIIRIEHLQEELIDALMYCEWIKDHLKAAPDVGRGTSFGLINGVHINLDQIRSFSWKDGELCFWYAGRHFFESWPDPERKLYKDICYALGVLPTEDPEE